MLNTCFLSGSPKFWYMLGRGCHVINSQEKLWGLSFSWVSLVDISHVSPQFDAGGIKHILSDSTGRELLEACIWYPLDFIPCAFSLCWFCLYPFAGINLSHEYDCMLSPMSPPSKSPNPGLDLGTPNTVQCRSKGEELCFVSLCISQGTKHTLRHNKYSLYWRF